MTFEPKQEGTERVNYADFWGKSFATQRTATAKAVWCGMPDVFEGTVKMHSGWNRVSY